MKNKYSVCLVTFKEGSDLTASDELFSKSLGRLGIRAEVHSWDDSDVDWQLFDAVVLRSCWDYHYRPHEFAEWINGLKTKNVNLINTYDLVFWNMHKSYLLELERKGISIVPTVYLKMGSNAHPSILNERGWNKIVVKPAIGTSAYEIFSGWVGDPKVLTKLEQLLLDQDVLVQPLMEEASQVGEYSSVFFDGSYSHTVLKKPKEGDFRSNYEQGGTASAVEQDDVTIKELQKILELLSPTPLYARVDYLMRDEQPILMELELIEPGLYMDLFPPSAESFANQLRLKLKSSTIAR